MYNFFVYSRFVAFEQAPNSLKKLLEKSALFGWLTELMKMSPISKKHQKKISCSVNKKIKKKSNKIHKQTINPKASRPHSALSLSLRISRSHDNFQWGKELIYFRERERKRHLYADESDKVHDLSISRCFSPCLPGERAWEMERVLGIARNSRGKDVNMHDNEKERRDHREKFSFYFRSFC